jgi:cyclopropane-fatty-acyl-phospholipid synthase
MKTLVHLIESGVVPDIFIRASIRALNRRRLRNENQGTVEALCDKKRAFVARLRQSPIAVLTDAANEQHYELPPEFFGLVLGKHRKYSCCFYADGTESLSDAEEKMLDLTCVM